MLGIYKLSIGAFRKLVHMDRCRPQTHGFSVVMNPGIGRDIVLRPLLASQVPKMVTSGSCHEK